MASPQRQFQPASASEREPVPSPRPQLHPSPSTPSPQRGRRKGWRYGISWILVAAALLIWYVGFGWGDSGGWIWGNRDSATAALNDGQISGAGVAILEVADKQDYAGQNFDVRNVPVDHWSGPNAVWIGSSHSYLPMLLILPPGTKAAAPPAGGPGPASPVAGQAPNSTSATPGPIRRFDVTGKIVKALPLREAQQKWKLSDEDVDQLEEEGVYIQGTKVRLVQH